MVLPYRPKVESVAEPRIVIGLDFGTTFSGIAFADISAGRENKVDTKVFLSWPGNGQTIGSTEKIPSRILYEHAPSNVRKWGNQITAKSKGTIHALMKLRLDGSFIESTKERELGRFLRFKTLDGLNLATDNEDEEEEFDPPPEYPGKDPVDIVADYLACVRDWVYTELRDKTYTPTVFAKMVKDLVVTVPAVWSEEAKDLTLRAVEKAGFNADSTMLIAEPEAAAIYTLKWMTEGANTDQIVVGDNIIVCDAGGGTVDIISYTVTQTTPVFKLAEAAVGSGDKCGASYVDKEFILWFEKWIGRKAFTKIPQEKRRHGSPLLNMFELAKNRFDGEDDDIEIYLPKEAGITDDEEKNVEGRVLTITNKQMKDIFDPCVNRTLELIDGQVASIIRSGRERPKMLFCVGGFCNNEYLFTRIADYCENRVGMAVRRPLSPWSAVVRGAVLRGIEGTQAGPVEYRLARRHYGATVNPVFDSKRHKEVDKFHDPIDGKTKARGQMSWLVTKGEKLPNQPARTASIRCHTNFRRTDPWRFSASLYGFDSDSAPTRSKDPGVYKICRMTADLSEVPVGKFDVGKTPGTGEEYLRAHFKLEATFGATMITWKFVFDGKAYASVEVSYYERLRNSTTIAAGDRLFGFRSRRRLGRTNGPSKELSDSDAS